MAWRDPRVRSVAQFLLGDSPPNSAFPQSDPDYWNTFQTGLEFANGTHKPAYASSRMPIWLPSSRVRPGVRIFIWGELRPAAHNRPQRATIEWAQRGGRYRTIAHVTTRNGRNFLTARVRVPSSGYVRIRWRGLVSRGAGVRVG